MWSNRRHAGAERHLRPLTTTLGRVDPVEAQTRNGIATTTFFAGDASGAAEVKAVSGGSGSATTGTGTTPSNAVTILIGAAAVDSVTVRSSAGSVPATGGSVDIIATVTSTGGTNGSTTVSGGGMPGVPVTFSTTAGALSSTREVTDGNGEARTRLTTDANATVTAIAGTKSGTVAIQALNPVATPTVSLTATGGTPLGRRSSGRSPPPSQNAAWARRAVRVELRRRLTQTSQTSRTVQPGAENLHAP
jgi:hypothetical protein